MIPTWFLLALLPPLIWATNYHMDKIIISRWGRGISNIQLAILSGLASVFTVIYLIVVDTSRLQGGWTFEQVFPSFLGGFAYFVALYFYYVAISREEVTRVAPLYSLAPLFGIIFGVGLLGEVIDFHEIIGILIVVAGGLLVDTRLVKHVIKINGSILLLMLASCAFFTLGSVGFKASSSTLGLGDNFLWFFSGSVVMTGLLLLHPKYRSDFRGLFISKRKWMVSGLIFSNCIGIVGRGLYNYVILLVPISFVQAVGAFESTFVLLIALVLWKMFRGLEPENLSTNILYQKAISVVLITVGSLLLVL